MSFGVAMSGHKVGTRAEWQAARDELARLEAEQAERNEEIKGRRLELPWVAVEKEYEFETEEGKKTLAELFEGRSQLLAYNIMFGPDYENGACPGCSNLGDGLEGSLVHLNERDVTLLCFSRAPIERLSAYKRRMGWRFPYVSTYKSDFAFDFGLALGAQGRAAREPELDRVRARERERLPHLHGERARPVRRALLQLPARANAERPARRAPRLAQGRVPGLTPIGQFPAPDRRRRSGAAGSLSHRSVAVAERVAGGAAHREDASAATKSSWRRRVTFRRSCSAHRRRRRCFALARTR